MKEFITKEIYIPGEMQKAENPLFAFNVIEEAYQEDLKYIANKIGKNYSFQKHFSSIKCQCPTKCGARKINLVGIFYSSDNTKRVLQISCSECYASFLIYQEAAT